MNRILVLLVAMALALGVSGVALADDGITTGDRSVLVAVNGNLDLAAGQQADVMVVVNGDVGVAGTARDLFVTNGSASIAAGASIDTITVINGTADIAAGATVTGNINQLNSTVNVAQGAQVGGTTRDITGDVASFGLFLGAAAILLWLGFAVATLLAILLLAAVAARQVRTATSLITREPLKTFLAGLVGIFVPPLLAIVAFITIIGIPAGLGLLLILWPATWFVGYLVAAIWIGEWLLTLGGRPPADRPYLAGFVGLLVASVLGIIPLISAVISIFGLGAVVLAAWRTFRRTPAPPPAFSPAQPMPAA